MVVCRIRTSALCLEKCKGTGEIPVFSIVCKFSDTFMKLWVSEEKLKMSMVEDKHVESFSVLYEQCDIL